MPLADIAITWDRSPGHFPGDKDNHAFAITGKHLAQVLAWLAHLRPGTMGAGLTEDVWEVGEVALEIEAVSEVLRGLGEVDPGMVCLETPRIFSALANLTADLASRLGAIEDGEGDAKRATVTIGRRGEKVA